MKLRFKGKPHFEEYHGAVNFVDGETKEINDIIGNYLLQDFSEYFEEVKPKEKTREIEAPPQDRMIRKGQTKRR